MTASHETSNPFIVPGRPSGKFPPLCPVTEPQHADMYASVDNAEQAFATFSSLTDRLNVFDDGHLVLAVGGEGCGKTSLLFRCAASLKADGTRGAGTVFVDLSNEAVAGADSAIRVNHAVARLIDKLSFAGLFTEAPMAKLTERAAEPLAAVPYLSEMLVMADKRLIVLLPTVTFQAELVSYINLVRPQLCILAESAAIAKSALGAHSSAPNVTELAVGGLHRGDGWRFVEHRLAMLTGPQIALSESTIDEYMSARLDVPTRQASIRELEITCTGVYQNAMDKGLDEILYAQFAEYYLRRGTIQ